MLKKIDSTNLYKLIIRKLLSLILFCFRSRTAQNLIMWPIAKRFLGLTYSEVVTFDNGLKIRVWLSYLDMHNRILLFYSNRVSLAWEPQTARLFVRLLEKAEKIVIAGANIGYYVIIAANKKNTKVISFEPVDEIRT